MIFSLTALVCIFAGSAFAVPPIADGNIIVESKDAVAGESFFVDISLTDNNSDISSLTIPLRFDQQFLTCDSVGFDASLIDPSMQASFNITDGSVKVSYIPPLDGTLPSFSNGSGHIARLFFTLDPDSPAGQIVIDTVYHDDSFDQFDQTFHKWTRTELTGIDGVSPISPGIETGLITVLRPTDVTDNENFLSPNQFNLDQNYPNPFNPTTTISFTLPERTDIHLEIFNIIGQSVAVVADGSYPAGTHNLTWDASGNPSGIYFYKISAESVTLTRKMVLMK